MATLVFYYGLDSNILKNLTEPSDSIGYSERPAGAQCGRP